MSVIDRLNRPWLHGFSCPTEEAMCAWRITLESLKESPRRFELQADPEWWQAARLELREPTAKVRSALRLEIDGHRIGRRLLFRGDLTGSLDLQCSRCLERYPENVEEPFQMLLEPASESPKAGDAGIELDPEDPEVGRYTGDELDFGPAVLEILALVWPMQPRCGETCLGLCSKCGTNRNLEACSCEEPSLRRPFADLKGLLERAREPDPAGDDPAGDDPGED